MCLIKVQLVDVSNINHFFRLIIIHTFFNFQTLNCVTSSVTLNRRPSVDYVV